MNLHLQLDRASWVPLQDQLFEQLQQLILDGRLKPNSRVIATRFLAEQVGVSRTTVLIAYERLISEGYLETRPAIGTFVSATPPKDRKPRSAQVSSEDIPRQASLRPVRFPGHLTQPINAPDGFIDFSPSLDGIGHRLPEKLWLKGVRNVFERRASGFGDLPPAAGVLALRQVIVDYLATTRGIAASPEQVIMVDGRRQACSFVAHLFQRRGERVVVETPGDEDVAGFFRARGADIVPVPVDEQGLYTDLLPKGPISMAYVTPTRQNPLGGTMPLSRRKALIDWARDAKAYVIEDDSDSELRYHGTTPLPLIALDPYGLVFYTGSFAETLGPGLGLAYLVVPAEFVDAILAIKAMAEGGRQWLEQMILADLLADGEYDHHLRRLRKQCLERRNWLIQALYEHFADIRLTGTEIGTQLTWILSDQMPAARVLCDVARAHGVVLKGVTCEIPSHAKGPPHNDSALLFGYANLTQDQIRLGVARLSDALSI